ncbi:MAG: hypothetical protein CBC55_00735 [Gammaproteobacteria bacterium TMED95]|nr:MAG: hypothetical protein CBC55_00735 [Gammaproteobacteria bacterium TMED95]|tara:strand:- start:7113 stop:7742 length:630 start_codon:yes stop_codon:yes gene_type:complete
MGLRSPYSSLHFVHDDLTGYLLMYSVDGALLGGLRYAYLCEKRKFSRVLNALSSVRGCGYGTALYTTALALLSQNDTTLSPDADSVSGSAVHIWAQFWCSPIVKTQPLPIAYQEDNYNLLSAKELHVSNPDIPERLLNKIISGDPQRLREFIYQKELNPHPYNFGYQMLTKDAEALLLDVSIELNTVTIEDIYEFENLWKRHYIASAKA